MIRKICIYFVNLEIYTIVINYYMMKMKKNVFFFNVCGILQRWHPDRCSSSGNSKTVEESKKKFQTIQQAYSGNPLFYFI